MLPEINTVWLHSKENYEIKVVGHDDRYPDKSVIVMNDAHNFFVCMTPVLFENGTFIFVRKENI